MKKVKPFFLIPTIALSILFAIPSFGQTDTGKFCFTSHEVDLWVGSYYDATAYKKVCDSLSVEVLNLNHIIDNSSLLIDGCRELVEVKDQALNASDKLSDEYKKQAEGESRKKRLWKNATFITGGAAIGIIIIQFLKP